MFKVRKFGLRGLVLAGLVFGAGMVQAALTPYTSDGAALVYSTDQNLTWTADANLFKTMCDAEGGSLPNICPELILEIIAEGSPVTHTGGTHDVMSDEFFQPTGQMSWFAANAWVEYLNSIAYGGATNWRLWEAAPSSDTNCSGSFDPVGSVPTQYYGYGCTGSELGYLYYEEGGAEPRVSQGPPISSLAPLAVFLNRQDAYYWSGTEYALVSSDAWEFGAGVGYQLFTNKGNLQLFAWAVRPGQIGPPTPIPTLSEWAQILLALSLMGMAGWYWQRKAS